MVPFGSTASTQIRFLLQSVNDSNFDSVFLELTQFIDYGLESSILLLQSCLGLHHFEGGLEKSIENTNHILLGTIIRYLLSKPNFSTILCESLRRNNSNSEDNNNGPVVKSVYVLGPLVNHLEFTVFERIAFGLALCDSEDVDVKRFGQSFCVSHIEEVLSAHHNGNGSIVDCSSEVIQSIVLFLTRTEGVAKHVDSFMQLVALVETKSNWGSANLAVLSPLRSADSSDEMRNSDLFYSENDDFGDILEEIEKEMSMADIVKELGYGCTVNVLHCKEVLSLFLPLNEVTVARLLSTIARTHGVLKEDSTHSTFCSALGLTSFDDPSLLSTWNVEVLVESIKQLAPDTNWIRVMENLDHEGLCFPSESSFSFFMSVYRNACQDPFPLHAICGTLWNNFEGQISFLRYAVSASPEVFTFEHSARQLVYVDAVHGHKLATGNANQAWMCLDLLDVLCQLAETGHAGSVRLMLDYPLKHCPEVLLLGLSQINTAYNLLQHEVLSAVFPMIVRNLSRAGVVLHLWNTNPIVVLRGLLDVQNFDSEGMIKTFDTCQELKILSPVLDMAPFSFSIKLAALASGKGQMNLDKWLNDNLSTYGDTFFEGCLKFLKEIHVGVPQDVLQHSGVVVIAYLETVPIFIKVLQGHAGQNVSRHHQLQELKTLHAVFIQNNTKPQNGGPADSSSPDGVYSDDVEGEANSYFHQMFSGQLSTDAMVQMLARFKESPDKREQDIYNFMIGNLFEEYKFFPKYPERQLKIVAVLFGSLIKHQLVTHLLLGVALRAVLDALRKSADSKMFVFGAKALEQFVDRLIEWPQYCNHILQISHLRSTHSELVMFIECALASISSSHAESNGGSVVPTDHQGLNPVPSHQGPNPPPEGMEVSESSWKVMGSGNSSTIQSRPQPPLSPSPFQVQQRNQVSPDDRHKSTGQLQSVGSSHDVVGGTQKTSVAPPLATVLTQGAPSVPVPVPTSTSFLRTSRGIPTASIPRQQSSTGFGSALNIETLVAAAERRDSPIDVPASETQDRILFLINNISSANFETKAKELTEVLSEEFYPWFGQYMVMKRASIEPNYHDQYLKFLDKVNSKVLNKEIVKATYENCKVLLRSELIKSSSEERSLLKNLGSWLGKLTIGRNQVLRAREIDPKALIIEAYEKGLMIAVIPFTSKILEPCQSSLAYQPPNPWTMGILGLLAEIYALPNLKMNLKFDIEVLLKNLGVEMKDVKPTSLLKDRVRELEGNPDFSNKDAAATKTQIIPEVNPPISVEPQPDVVIPSHPGGLLTEDEKMPALTLPERLPSGQGLPVNPSQSPFSVSQLPTPIANIGTDVIVNPKISALGLQLQFQRIVPMAMERAIKEIMSPVVQRSVTIAIQTTKELVLKDYAMESDETRIYNAAHLMVASLAGSLAHVTCKEPLRVSISSHLRNMIQPLNVSNDLEQAVQISTNDNLDLGCAVVEKAAIEKALQTIDGEIAGQLAVRRKRRDALGPAYFDATTYTQGPMGGVPEALRPKPGRLSLSQQRVYEDFVRFPWQNQPSQSSNALPAVQNSFAGGSGSSSLPRSYGLASGQPNPTLYSSTQGDPGFGSVVQPLALASEDMDAASTQILSAPSAHIAASDVVTQHGSDIDSVVPSFPSTVASTEPISVDPSDSRKDSGAAAQPLPESFGTEHLSTNVGDLLSTEDVLEKYHIVAQKLEDLISKDSKDVEVQGVIVEVPEIIIRSVSRDEAAVVVARDVFKSLYGNTSNSTHVGAQIAILVALRDVCKVAVKEQLTGLVIYSEDEYKFNKDIIVGLIRSELLNLAEYGMHMAKLIDAGRNTTATEFAVSLLQALVTQESGVGVSELHNLIEALAKLTTRPGSPESLPQLLEIARDVSANASAPSGYMVSNDEKANQARDRKAPSARPSVSRGDDYNNVESMTADPHGFREQVSMLFNEWYRISEAMGTNDAAVTRFVSQLQQSGLLKGDDMTDGFFRLLTELSVTHCLSTEVFTPGSLSLQSPQQASSLSFIAIDMYAKLVILILKYCAVDQGSNKLFLLPKILLVTVRAIQKDADERKIAFNPRPYFRLFVNWLLDLGSPDSVLEGANFQILTAFANVFHALQPLKVPGFSYAWLELVSHRSFMPKLLYGNSQKTSPYVQRLLVDLFKFMEPYLRYAGKSQLGDPVHFLYKGTLRVLLVLLHDFPEFLCNYHFSFCDVIPPSCIQMRNVILSAFPRNMRLPDPSTPNLKIDLLAEISQSPCIFSDVDAAVKAKQMKGDIDEYLKTRQQGPSFLAELKQRVLLSQGEAALAGTRYNVPLMNSLVLYVGMQAIQQLQTKTPPSPQMAHTAPMDIFLVGSAMDIFQTLIGDLDTEGRYLFLNALANQLRYPNNHTHYFSFVLLYLFAEANQEAVQEQITRVLLERLIVNRPHPWGLLITFIELIKNPRYNFWTCSFTRCAPEIEKLFESVSRSCGGPKTPDESLVSDGGAH